MFYAEDSDKGFELTYRALHRRAPLRLGSAWSFESTPGPVTSPPLTVLRRVAAISAALRKAGVVSGDVVVRTLWGYPSGYPSGVIHFRRIHAGRSSYPPARAH